MTTTTLANGTPVESLPETLARTIKVLEKVLAIAKGMEEHIPTKADRTWITCSCGNIVKPGYWTRHTTGADGSFSAPRPLIALIEN